MDLQSLNVAIGANLQGLQQGLRNAVKEIRFFSAVGGVALDEFAKAAGAAGKKAGDALASGFNSANGKLAAGFANLDAQTKVFEAGFGRLGGVFKSVGEDFSKYVTLPIVAGIGLSAKAAIDFESAFAGVKKTLNTTGLDAEQTEAEYSRLSDGIRQMAKEIPVAATELAKIGESAGQLGIQRNNVLGFTRTIADLGVATNLVGEEAASTLAKFANISQLDQSQFGNLGSSIVALGNNFATTERDIAAMGLRIAGAGKQVGLTEAQVLGFSAALSSVGIEAEAGGTAFSTVLKKIQVATEVGGKSLEGFAKVAGKSSAEFKKNFQTDAAGAVVAFIEGLGKIKSEGGSTIQTLKSLELGNVRTSDSLLRLAGAGDLTRRATTLASKAYQENTALTKEAGQRYETTASQIQVAKNRLTDLGITIGNQLLPLIKGMSSLLGGASNALNNMSPAAAKTTLIIAGLVAAIGPLTLTIGGIISLLPTLAAGFGALGAAVTVATGPIGIAVVAIAALATGIGYLSNQQERSVQAFQQARQATNELNGTLAPLLARYDELTGKTKLTNTEQAELKRIVEQVAKAVPSAVTQVDAYGKATAISTTKTREFVAALKEVEKQKALQALPGATAQLKDFERRLAAAKKQQQEFNKTGSLTTPRFNTQGIQLPDVKAGAGSKEVQELQRQLAEVNLEYIKQKELVASLNQSAGKSDVSAVAAANAKAAADLTKKQHEAADAAQKHAVTLGELKDQLKAAREKLDTLAPGTKEFNATKALIASLDAQIRKYEDTGKAAQKAASDISKAFQDVQKKLGAVDTQVKLGITAGGAEATTQKIKVLEEGLKRLSELGVGSANKALLALNTQLLQLQQSLTRGVEPITVTATVQVKTDTQALPSSLPSTLVDEANAVANANLSIAQGMREVNAASLVFGNGFDTAAAKANVLAQELQNLLAAGVSPLNPQVQALGQQLQTLSEQQSLISTFRDAVQSSFAGIADSIGQAFGAIVTGSATLGQGLQFVFGNIISTIGDFMGTMGQQLIALGVAKLGLDKLFAAGAAGGPAAIAAGIGLVALAGVARAVGKQSAGSLGQITGAGGGSYSSPNQSSASRPQPLKLEVTFQPVELRAEGSTLRSLMQVDEYRLTTTR